MHRRRIASFSVTFMLGAVVGGTVLHFGFRYPIDGAEAQRRALRLLDSAPAAHVATNVGVVSAVRRIEPAVVNIDTLGRIHRDGDDEIPWPFDQEVRGKGSGVVLTPDGYIVTNNHVIEGANWVRVTLPNGHWYYARTVGRDVQNDLAVVKIDAHDLPAATLGDSDSLQVGELSVAVGNPLGLGSTVTSGIISALNRHNLQLDEGRTIDGAIQTDAPINKGNSGGALADGAGNLIGINTAILSAGPNGGSIGLGFAIPVNTVRRVVRELIANGRPKVDVVKRPWIGVTLEALPAEMADANNIPRYHGVLIGKVKGETPASIAGLEDGDILLSIDGEEVALTTDVKTVIQRHRSSDRVRVHIMRPSDRRTHDFEIVIQETPESISLSP
jgi:S1-C subfamily serine protease